MKIKEPKWIIAMILLTYIVFSAVFVLNNFSEKYNSVPREVTGLATNGRVSINIISRCSNTLVQEYNLISICANFANKSVGNVLQSINGKYLFVLRWNKTTQEFDTYSPEASENAFNTIELNESYFVFMEEGAVLSMSGDDTNDTDIYLNPEFNAPGYPYRFTSNVTRYINPIRENVSFMLKWNKTGQEFITYSPEAAVNQFEMIERSEGQLIFMTYPAVLRYNKTLLQS